MSGFGILSHIFFRSFDFGMRFRSTTFLDRFFNAQGVCTIYVDCESGRPTIKSHIKLEMILVDLQAINKF